MRRALITGITGQDGSYLADLLLKKGADVNAKTNLGKTPLLVAASQDGSMAVVKMLLAKGADINARDKAQGLTPLLAAAIANDTAVTKLLLERGTDVNVAIQEAPVFLAGLNTVSGEITGRPGALPHLIRSSQAARESLRGDPSR